MKKIILAAVCAALILTGCSSKRSIDPVSSGSVPVPGTSWMRFCDGPNAVIWIPGYSGEADELEAYIYDHHACSSKYYDQNPTAESIRPHDEDGISEDE